MIHTYESVLSILSPEFLKACCELSNDYNAIITTNHCGKDYNVRVNSKTNREHFFILRWIDNSLLKKYDGTLKYFEFNNLHEKHEFENLLFQAWIGFNRNSKNLVIQMFKKEIKIILHRTEDKSTHGVVGFKFSEKEKGVFKFSDFEPDKLLPPEIQALAMALNKAMELEETK